MLLFRVGWSSSYATGAPLSWRGDLRGVDGAGASEVQSRILQIGKICAYRKDVVNETHTHNAFSDLS